MDDVTEAKQWLETHDCPNPDARLIGLLRAARAAALAEKAAALVAVAEAFGADPACEGCSKVVRCTARGERGYRCALHGPDRRDAAQGQIAALRKAAKDALDFVDNVGRWCDSAIEEHGSAWHISPHDDARWGELQEALGRAVVDSRPVGPRRPAEDK